MENASKALIFAGGLLISMLIVAALIFTISQVRNLKSQEQQAEQTDEVAEYNNKFNKYASENLYGVDLISLCNEVSNYNAKESKNKYYSKINLVFDFRHASPSILLGDESDIFIKNTVYHYTENSENDNTNLLTQYKAFEKKYNKLANINPTFKDKKNQTYTIKQLASMRNDELKNKFDEDTIEEMSDPISNYNSLKSSFTEFKTKKFKGEITNQDNTGRITQMTFTSK